jgi:hypothetical protein
MGYKRNEPSLLPGRIHGAISKNGKNRINRLSRQFRRNVAHEANNNKGVCFNVLEVFPSFPGGEAGELGTSMFFQEAQSAQRELIAWASTTVPNQRAEVQNALEVLRTSAANNAPIAADAIPAYISLLERVGDVLNVHQHCPHLAPTTVAAEPEPQDMDQRN